MQISFYKVVQEKSEETGKEMTSKDITNTFRHTYHLGGSVYDGRLVLKNFVTKDIRNGASGYATPDRSPYDRRNPSPDGSEAGTEEYPPPSKKIYIKILVDGKLHEISGEGNGPLSSFLDALRKDLGIHLSVREYTEHGVGAGSDVKAATYVEVIPPDVDARDKTKGGYWGVGIDVDITASGLKAVLSAANAALGDGAIAPAPVDKRV
jgi:2-isopropylmalate synthase